MKGIQALVREDSQAEMWQQADTNDQREASTARSHVLPEISTLTNWFFHKCTKHSVEAICVHTSSHSSKMYSHSSKMYSHSSKMSSHSSKMFSHVVILWGYFMQCSPSQNGSKQNSNSAMQSPITHSPLYSLHTRNNVPYACTVSF